MKPLSDFNTQNKIALQPFSRLFKKTIVSTVTFISQNTPTDLALDINFPKYKDLNLQFDISLLGCFGCRHSFDTYDEWRFNVYSTARALGYDYPWRCYVKLKV